MHPVIAIGAAKIKLPICSGLTHRGRVHERSPVAATRACNETNRANPIWAGTKITETVYDWIFTEGVAVQ